MTTDGVWCYIVLWVVPHYDTLRLRWSHLKNQLVSVCPSCSTYFVLDLMSPCPASTPVYLLKFFCLDRNGLLHGTTVLIVLCVEFSYECVYLDCVRILFFQMLLKY